MSNSGKRTVGVIFGSRSVEHDVSIVTAQQVMQAMPPHKYDVVPIYITREGCWLTGPGLPNLKNFQADNIAELMGISQTLISPSTQHHGIITPPTSGLLKRSRVQRLDVVFPVVHGSQPKFTIPEIVEDMHRAVRYIRFHAKDYQIDPDRLGIVGGSAGGHLSLMIACAGASGDPNAKDPVDRDSSRVQAVCGYCAPSDFLQTLDIGGREKYGAIMEMMSVLIGGPIEDNREKAARANPITYISGDEPPFLLIHGDVDALVPCEQSKALHKALKEAECDVTLHVVEGCGHVIGGPDLSAMAEQFFDRCLKK